MSGPDFSSDVPFPLGGYLPDSSEATIREPARDVPVVAECDVAVFGGGPAGVCAAVAAARAGKRVLLVERHGFLGGMATAADVNIWHSLYGMDGKTKVIGGLVEEAIRRLQGFGAARNHADDGETSVWTICPMSTRFVFDDMAIGSGVKLMLHARLAGVLRDGRRITAALVESKTGRGAVRAATFIDATGDGDLVRFSGEDMQLGNHHGRCQPPGMTLRVAGRKKDWTAFGEIQRDLFHRSMDYNDQPYPTFLWGSRGIWSDDEAMLAGVRVLGVNAADTDDLTRSEIEGRYQLRWLLRQLTRFDGWENVHLAALPAQIGIRESHRILAEHQLTRENVLEGERFDDTIAQGTYEIDIHDPDGPGITFEHIDGRSRTITGESEVQWGRWDGQPNDAPLRDTLCYFVPYRSLIPRGLDNGLAAGRCAGANHDSAGAIRVMVNCMQLGQAAGMAAAMATDGDVCRVDSGDLRDALTASGVPLL